MSKIDTTLTGWCALVTGGGSGIGLGVAEILLKSGCTVTIAGRSEDRLKGAVALLEAKVEGPSRVFYSVCDVTIESDVKSTLKSAYENGGKKLNAVVMSAGANFGVKNIPHVDLETWNQTIAANMTSAFLTIKHSAPYLARTIASLPIPDSLRPPTASIVAISTSGSIQPYMNIAPYLASKAGMNQLAKNAANEFGKWRIRVNSILPALVRTEMADLALQNLGVMADIMENTPLGRIGEVADVAELARFLVGPESGWITGTQLFLDGGMHLRRAFNLQPVAVEMLGNEADGLPDLPE